MSAQELDEAEIAYVQGLHDLADFLAEHPGFIQDAHEGTYGMECFLNPDAMVTRAREIGGDWQQSTEGRYVKLTRRFGPHYVYLFTDAKNVGEAFTETRIVTSWRVPDLLPQSPPSEPRITA